MELRGIISPVPEYISSGNRRNSQLHKTICSKKGGDLIKEAKTFAKVANISFIAAGSSLLIGIVFLLVAPSNTATPEYSSSISNTQVLPVFSSNSAGATINGTF